MCNPTSGGQTDLSSPHQTWRGPDLLLMITSCTVDPADALCALRAHQTRCAFFTHTLCAAGPNSTAGVQAIAFDNAASKCELHALDDQAELSCTLSLWLSPPLKGSPVMG